MTRIIYCCAVTSWKGRSVTLKTEPFDLSNQIFMNCSFGKVFGNKCSTWETTNKQVMPQYFASRVLLKSNANRIFCGKFLFCVAKMLISSTEFYPLIQLSRKIKN